MRKNFPTLGVLGAYTGFVLSDHGFSQIHEVFDFYYPGIMTLGVAAMANDIKSKLLACVPGLENCTSESVKELGWKEFAKSALLQFGESIQLSSEPGDSFNPLKTELEYFSKHARKDAQIALVVIPETES